MSAPHSPGGVSSASASRSVATVTTAPRGVRLVTQRAPVGHRAVAGRIGKQAPTTFAPNANVAGSPTRISTPRASARVRTTAIVCGWQPMSTSQTGVPSCFVTAIVIAIASAAAVPSSSSDALAIGSAGEVTDHRLEGQQRFEPPLRDLGLVRRVRRVPAGILEHVALDHRRHDRAGIPHADVRAEYVVARGKIRAASRARRARSGRPGRSSVWSEATPAGITAAMNASSDG